MLSRRFLANSAVLSAFSAGFALIGCSDLPGVAPFGAGAGGTAATGGSAGGGGAGGSGGTSKGGSGGQASGKGGSGGSAGSGTGGTSGSASGGKGGTTSGGSANGGSASGGRGDDGGSAGQGSAGKGGGGGRGGAGGQGGRGGAASGGKSGDTGEGGNPPTSGNGCDGDYLICEDFESTDVGDVPDGWTRRGDEANVADDQAHGGDRSLKLGAVPTAERRISRSASVLGSAHWGRVFYKVETPPPDAFVHSTMVMFRGVGPTVGASEFRTIDLIKQAIDTRDVGSRHNFAYNVEPDDGPEFNHETNYDYTFDDDWHCAEYHIQASNQSYEFFFDGESILDFENGAGDYDGSEIPDSFSEVRVGWINYQNASPGFTVWIDDVAFDDERIGCE